MFAEYSQRLFANKIMFAQLRTGFTDRGTESISTHLSVDTIMDSEVLMQGLWLNHFSVHTIVDPAILKMERFISVFTCLSMQSWTCSFLSSLVYPCSHAPVHFCLHLSVNMIMDMFIYVFTCLSTRSCTCSFMSSLVFPHDHGPVNFCLHLSVHTIMDLFISVFTCLSTWPCLSVHMTMDLFISVFTCLSTRSGTCSFLSSLVCPQSQTCSLLY